MAEPDHTAPQRIAVGRTIGLVLAAAGIAVSAKCASDCIRLNAEFHRWAIARPMDIEADFSKPGEIAVPFQQTCSISHGESVCLQITPPLDELYEPAQLLDDLSGRIVIRDSTGREIERGVFGATTIRRRAAGETIVLTDFAPFATGDYVVTVSVDQGSPELKDRRQRLYIISAVWNSSPPSSRERSRSARE